MKIGKRKYYTSIRLKQTLYHWNFSQLLWKVTSFLSLFCAKSPIIIWDFSPVKSARLKFNIGMPDGQIILNNLSDSFLFIQFMLINMTDFGWRLKYRDFGKRARSFKLFCRIWTKSPLCSLLQQYLVPTCFF